MKNIKYIAVGIIVGYLGLYILELSRAKLAIKNKEISEEETNN
jgi:hypothetical protein